MANEKKEDPLSEAVISLSKVFEPLVAAFSEYFKLWGGITDLLKRIQAAQALDRGMALSATEVKTLCLLLKGLQDGKK